VWTRDFRAVVPAVFGTLPTEVVNMVVPRGRGPVEP
jgi:hypothetical protein